MRGAVAIGIYIATLGAAAFAAPAPATQRLAPPARLRFDWPVGVIANVDSDYRAQSNTGGVIVADSHLRMTHVMQVLASDAGQRIEFSNQRYVESAGDVTPGLRALLSFWIPVTIVDTRGRFVRVERAERVQGLLNDIYAPLLAGLAAQTSPTVIDSVRRLLAGDGVRQVAASDWSSRFGRWVEAPLDPAPTTTTISETIGPGLTVPATVTQRFLERVSCMRDNLTIPCATFEARKTFAATDLERIRDFMIRGANSATAAPFRLDSLETVDRATVEVATLLPHSIVTTRTMRRAIDSGGQTVTTLDIERQIVAFAYSRQ